MKIGKYELRGSEQGWIHDGNMDMRGLDITKLPKDLLIKGGLIVSDSQMPNLPDGLIVTSFIQSESEIIPTADALFRNGTWIKASRYVGEIVSFEQGIYEFKLEDEVLFAGKDSDGEWVFGKAFEDIKERIDPERKRRLYDNLIESLEYLRDIDANLEFGWDGELEAYKFGFEDEMGAKLTPLGWQEHDGFFINGKYIR